MKGSKNMNIHLCEMTRKIYHAYLKEFRNDPVMFLDTQKFVPFQYSQSAADANWERQRTLGRTHLAVMQDQEPIGEVVLKNIDQEKRCCTLGIHLKNDSFKNKGYGTQAEILTLQYAFTMMGMDTVYADALLKNERSQHVLQKVGFTETDQDENFRYYRCDKMTWGKT